MADSQSLKVKEHYLPPSLLGYSSLEEIEASMAEVSDDHPSEIIPAIQNVVSTVNLECKLHLPSIALKALNTEYNPKRFSAVIMRIRNPKTSALIFESGKMVCTGAKSEDESKIATRKFARIIQKLGFAVKFNNFKIHNIVGSCDVGFPVRLETMSCGHHASSCLYEPELFPGLIYKMMIPRVTVLVFASGKTVIAGAKLKDDLAQAFHKILPLLQLHKRP